MKNNWVIYAMFLSLSASAELVDKTVATVGKEPILKSDVDALTSNPATGVTSSKEALDALLGREALTASCKQSGNYPEAPEVKQTINDIKRQNRISDDVAFMRALQQNHTTLEAYEKQVAGEMCRNRIVYGKIRGRINITDDDIQRAYEREYGPEATKKLRLRDMRFLTPDAELRKLDKAKREAGVALNKLKDGRSWEVVFKEAKKSGAQVVNEDLGALTRKDLLASIADAVFTDAPGNLRGPIQTEDGIHVIEITERVEGQQTPLAQVKNDLHKQLLDQETERLLRQYVEEAKSSIYIDVMGV